VGDQFSMPGEQGLGRDNRSYLPQHLPSQPFGLGCQSTALVVIEPQSAPTQLLAKNPVLLAEVIQALPLALVHPPGDGDQHEPERIQDSRHLVRSLSRASVHAVNNQREFMPIRFSDHTGIFYRRYIS
jgi:hypothetical protein